MKQIIAYVITIVLVGLVTFCAVYFGDKEVVVTPVEGGLPDVSLSEKATDFLLTAAITPIIVVMIEIAKALGALPDGTAGKIQAIGQALAYFAILLVENFFGLDIMNPVSQSILAVVLIVLQAVLGIIVAIGVFKGGRKVVGVLKSLPGRA